MIVSQKKKKIASPAEIADVMFNVYNQVGEEDKHKELFYAIGLNSNNTIIYIDLVSLGTVNKTVPYIREVIRTALIRNAVNVICVHNHPSGNKEPSRADLEFTRKLVESVKYLDLKIMDHLIVSDDRTFYSFSDNNSIVS